MVIIGLTGEIASGKNFVSNHLKHKGIKVFDADTEVHKLLLDGSSETYKKVTHLFPESVRYGRIHRDILGRLAFPCPKKLKQLEDTIYPELTKKLKHFIIEQKDDKQELIAINAPTLYKAKWDKKCHYVIYLHVDQETQEKRYFERGDISLERFRQIKKHQDTRGENKKKADFLINTSKDKKSVIKEIDATIKCILEDEKK